MSATESDLYFRQLPVGEMANLAYLIGSRSTREALVVDPAWNVDQLLDKAEQDDVRVTGALVTHYHQDHIGGSLFGHEIEGLARFQERNPSPVHAHKLEAEGVAKIAGIETGDMVSHDAGDAPRRGHRRPKARAALEERLAAALWPNLISERLDDRPRCVVMMRRMR